MDSGHRAAFSYFEGAGFTHGPNYKYPNDAVRITKRWFSSSDQLVTMIMGGEIYLPGYEKAWLIGRQLGLQVAAHIVSAFGMRPTFDALAQGQGGDSGKLGFGAAGRPKRVRLEGRWRDRRPSSPRAGSRPRPPRPHAWRRCPAACP
jgi:hypothetical protein